MCSRASCDIHISPFSINLYFNLNVLLVLTLNLIVHKPSYCKCSLAWCQARTFLLFTIWTHPLQMREYPLQYASTDKNKKSHYNQLLLYLPKMSSSMIAISAKDEFINDYYIYWSWVHQWLLYLRKMSSSMIAMYWRWHGIINTSYI